MRGKLKKELKDIKKSDKMYEITESLFSVNFSIIELKKEIKELKEVDKINIKLAENFNKLNIKEYKNRILIKLTDEQSENYKKNREYLFDRFYMTRYFPLENKNKGSLGIIKKTGGLIR